MSANVGSIDRIIRILAGLALIAWALTGGPPGMGLDRRGAARHRPAQDLPGL